MLYVARTHHRVEYTMSSSSPSPSRTDNGGAEDDRSTSSVSTATGTMSSRRQNPSAVAQSNEARAKRSRNESNGGSVGRESTMMIASNDNANSSEGSWNEYFGRLCAFQRVKEHCLVPKKNELGVWVSRQRKEYRDFQEGKPSSITAEQIKQLASVGFAWDHREEKYDFMLNLLNRFRKENGHCCVPHHYTTTVGGEKIRLGRWVDTQRRQHSLLQDGKHSDMTQERIARLKAIGFDFGNKKPDKVSQWQKHLNLVKEYKKVHGNCQIPIRHVTDDGVQLGNWAGQQRFHFRRFHRGEKAKITQERINELHQIGFFVGEDYEMLMNPSWDAMVEALRQHKFNEGNFHVPNSFVAPGGANMAAWIQTQRSEYRKLENGETSRLSQEQIQKLNGIGFDWVVEPFAAKPAASKSSEKIKARKRKKTVELEGSRDKEVNGWDDDFEALREYGSKHGHCNPDRMPTEDLQIRSWAEEQRNQYHRFLDGKITAMTLDRIEKLTSLGFVWSAEEEDGTSLLR